MNRTLFIMIFPRPLLLAFVFIHCFSMLSSQSALKQPFNIKIQSTFFSNRKYIDTTGAFSFQSNHVELDFDLGKIKLDTGLITFRGNVRQLIQPVHFFDQYSKRTLLTSSLGLRTVYFDYKRMHGYFVLSNRLLIQADNKIWSLNNPKYSGSFMYSRLNTKKWKWNIGISYTYVYGNGILFPLVGFNWAIDSHQTVRFILPFLMSYQYKTTNSIFTIAFHPLGGRNALGSPLASFTGNQLQVSIRQSVLGFRYGIKILKNGIIGFESGICGKAKLRFDSNSLIKPLNYNTKPGIYSTIFLRIPLFQNKEEKQSDLFQDYDPLLDNF